MKTKIYTLQINSDILVTLGFYSLLLIGTVFSTNKANATDLLGNESVYELIEQVETYQQQEKFQMVKQRKVTPGTAFSHTDTEYKENSYTHEFIINDTLNIVDVNRTSLNQTLTHSLDEAQGAFMDGKDASLFSDSGLNNPSVEIERMN